MGPDSSNQAKSRPVEEILYGTPKDREARQRIVDTVLGHMNDAELQALLAQVFSGQTPYRKEPTVESMSAIIRYAECSFSFGEYALTIYMPRQQISESDQLSSGCNLGELKKRLQDALANKQKHGDLALSKHLKLRPEREYFNDRLDGQA